MKYWKTLLFMLFLLGGVVIGGLVSELTEGIKFLSWLGYGQNFGIGAQNPVVLDLSIVQISFGLNIKITVSILIFVVFSIFLYKKLVK